MTSVGSNNRDQVILKVLKLSLTLADQTITGLDEKIIDSRLLLQHKHEQTLSFTLVGLPLNEFRAQPPSCPQQGLANGGGLSALHAGGNPQSGNVAGSLTLHQTTL